MKKLIYLFIILLILSGCNNLNNNKLESKKDIILEKDKEETKKEEVKESYQDNNPIKIGFYQSKNGKFIKMNSFKSKVESFKEIGIFSMLLSSDEEVIGTSRKQIYSEVSKNIPNFSNYKIGYNLKFIVEDGSIVDENILKPLTYNSYPFNNYIYVWLYDDINTTGWHSHIEEADYNQDSVLSSIKLMWAPNGKEIISNIELTIFTYDLDDFDELGKYRGISKHTIIIEKDLE